MAEFLHRRRQRNLWAVHGWLKEAGEWRHGYDISRGSGVPAGAVYLALARLERKGHVVSRWADSPEPRRREYLGL